MERLVADSVVMLGDNEADHEGDTEVVEVDTDVEVPVSKEIFKAVTTDIEADLDVDTLVDKPGNGRSEEPATAGDTLVVSLIDEFMLGKKKASAAITLTGTRPSGEKLKEKCISLSNVEMERHPCRKHPTRRLPTDRPCHRRMSKPT